MLISAPRLLTNDEAGRSAPRRLAFTRAPDRAPATDLAKPFPSRKERP